MKKLSAFYNMLAVILFGLAPCEALDGDALVDLSAADGFRQMIFIAMRKNHERFHYLQSQQTLLEIDKEKLQKKRSFSFSPYLTRSDQGGFSPGVTGNLKVNEYVGEFSVVPYGSETDNYLRFMVPLFGVREKKIKLMTDMIDLTIRRSAGELEMSVFNELQSLLIDCIALKKIRDEIEIRDTLSRKTQSLIELLGKIENSGIIPKRSLNSIVFFNDDNVLSTEVLYRRLTVNENKLMDGYLMNPLEIQNIDERLPQLLNYIAQRKNKEVIDNLSYSEQLSRIDREILDKNIRMNTMSDYTISAGPTINGNGGFSKLYPGIAAELTVDIFPQKALMARNGRAERELIRRKDIPRSSIDSTAKRQIASAERIIASCIEEMSLGNINSMYSLTELLNKVLNQQLNLISLRYEEIESKILSYKKLADFGISTIYAQSLK